jgi:hydroxymethylglutaryl-CoA lyase
MAPPAAVRIVEVGPRDGLQNIKNIVPTGVKAELIKRLANTGLQVIEATSFVSPKWIPQLADSRDVMQAIGSIALSKSAPISFPVLVPNVKGLEAAAKAGVKDIGVFVSAAEGFSRKNINCSIEESLARVSEVTKIALSMGIRVRG